MRHWCTLNWDYVPIGAKLGAGVSSNEAAGIPGQLHEIRALNRTTVFTALLPFLSVVTLLVCPAAAQPAGGPALHYGHIDSLPAPKTLLFSVGSDKIIADAPAWKAMGVDGFFLDNAASEWSSNIWATDGKPHTIGESDETFQKVRQAVEVCDGLGMEVYLKLVYANPLEWFNEAAWQHIYHNFRQFAIFARDTGCKGVAVDIEYVGQQYAFDWEGYDYAGYTRKDLVRTIRERSTEILRAMYAEYPDMVYPILPEESFTLGTHIETAWVEEAARQQAPGGVHLFMESTYTAKDIRRALGCAAADVQLFERLLSPKALTYWKSHCSLASGVWPTGYDVLEKTPPAEIPDVLRECWAASLLLSPRYNWIYADRYAEQHLGRNRDAFPGGMDFDVCADILRRKEMVTDAPYVALARQLRALDAEADTSTLGLSPVPRFMFPYAVPMLELEDTAKIGPEEQAKQWRMAMDYYNGEPLDLVALFSPVPTWQIIGPFPSGEPLTGHNTVFGPEKNLDLAAEYGGVNGTVRWQPYVLPPGGLGIDFKPLYEPSEQTTAYALCWVESPLEQAVQARFASNDAGKLWIGGKLVDDFGRVSWSELDRDIIPVTLPKGRTPVLAKVTNGIGGWALVLRFTDERGDAISNLRFSNTP